MNNSTLLDLQELINISFNNIELLQRAMTHRSYLNETNDKNLKHNERLEFLGDAVLELLITEYLFHTYPDRTEGDLTSFRSATVRTESLADLAFKLNLGTYIYMSKGEESTGGRTRPYILANAVEALLGAIYLDQGMEKAHQFVNNFLIPKIDIIVEQRLDIDSKSKLQEVSQQFANYTPIYEVTNEEGPDHNKTFTIVVKITNIVFGTGKGKNKQEAEQKAAEVALGDWDKKFKYIKK
jgi:ribonuclease III